MQHAEKTLKPVADTLQMSAAEGHSATTASIRNRSRVVAQRQPLRSLFGEAVQLQVGLENEAPAQAQAAVQVNGLQAAINRSPRMPAQRRALGTAFGNGAGAVVQRNSEEDRRKADGYIVLIEHQITQDHEDDADDFDDPDFYRRLLAALSPDRIIKIWEEGLVEEFIAKAPAHAEAMKAMLDNGIDAETAQSALLFAFNGDLAKVSDRPTLARAAQVALLFRHVSSILASGVLSPAELRKRKIIHTPSSDTDAHDHISAFDIDHERNADEHYAERFPLPGHQSVSPVLERQNDIDDLGQRMLDAARKRNATALAHIATMQTQKNNTDPPEQFIEMVGNDAGLVRRLGTLARFDPGGMRSLANRAMNSAVVISSGASLAGSDAAKHLKKPGLGPRVAELRAPTSIEPKDMTQVLLPDFMKGFPLLKRWSVPVVFVGTVNTQVGYYDERSRVQQQLMLPIPDFQSAIDAPVNQGIRKMLTHITNVGV